MVLIKGSTYQFELAMSSSISQSAPISDGAQDSRIGDVRWFISLYITQLENQQSFLMKKSYPQACVFKGNPGVRSCRAEQCWPQGGWLEG